MARIVALSMVMGDGLDIACSRPPLGVKYDIDYYDGTVNCGTVLLEADIGGGINVQPTITFDSAKSDSFYTLLYVDPDATSGSWPDVTEPGDHAPVRHWVAGNIPGSALKSGDLTVATQVQPYKGPSPPTGSHRYAQWLFEQPDGEIDFEDMPDSIIQWDYEAFIEKHNLASPVASNWHVTQYAPHRDSTGNTGGLNSAQSLVNLNCSSDPLHVQYDIKYYSGRVRCGTLLLEADIGGGIDIAPTVAYRHAEPNNFYTLIYVDPDADMTGSWPNASVPGPHAPVRHWLAGNIPGHALQRGDLSSATTVSAFKGPSPPAGSHRYGQWIFSQGSRQIDYPALDDAVRINWDYQAFISKYELGDVVASNWHVTQHMEPRTTIAVVV